MCLSTTAYCPYMVQVLAHFKFVNTWNLLVIIQQLNVISCRKIVNLLPSTYKIRIKQKFSNFLLSESRQNLKDLRQKLRKSTTNSNIVAAGW